MASDQDYNLSPDALSAMTPVDGNLSAKLNQAAEDEAARYRGRVAGEQPQIPETPSFGWGGIEPITQPKPQEQPPYDYAAANLESGRNLSRQSFVDSYEKQHAASPWVETLNHFASALAGRPAAPYNASAANYRQLTPSEEAEKYRREQSEYAGLAAGIATPELASATGLARFAPGPNQLNIFMPARDLQKTEAIRMEAEGLHPNTIWKHTGAFRDVDGRWMREISDADSRITPEAQQFLKENESVAGPAQSVFEHPELYKQAPGMEKYRMDLEQEPEFITAAHHDFSPRLQEHAETLERMGYSPEEISEQSLMRRTPSGEWEQRYFPLGLHMPDKNKILATGANPEDFRKTLLHESQHAIDQGMGRPNYGANQDAKYLELSKLPKDEVIARAEASRLAGSKWAPNIKDYGGNWEGFLRQQAVDEYVRNAAEVRARNVETRRDMSPQERLQTHPFKTMEVKPENQIIGYEPGATTVRSQPVAPEPRSLDQLGFYSQALEAAKALPQAKGTPEQMIAQLKKAGVKDAEIQATNLPQFLEGKKSVTRDEIAQHLNDNRLQLNEVTKGQDPEVERLRKAANDAYLNVSNMIDSANASGVKLWQLQANPKYQAALQARADADRALYQAESRTSENRPKWNNYSLDPQNPTYRETVLHLPVERRQTFPEYLKAYRERYPNNTANSDEKVREFYDRGLEIRPAGQSDIANKPDVMFQSGHFSEPNITGHLMTSMVKDQNGRNVFNVDQIQSDWGQKLREGGVRDEAKIAQLKDAWKQAEAENERIEAEAAQFMEAIPHKDINTARYLLKEYNPYHQLPYGPIGDVETLLNYGREDVKPKANALLNKWKAANSEANRLQSEYSQAKQSPVGHPLVNTTDQWTNTTLRHAIKQAAESGADAISIPSGKTVLSYNPGDEHGMNEFYGKIVPKNLGKLLKKIDPQAPAPEYHEHMVTPNKGATGKGFTLFPLTDKIKQSVLKEGQPLFKRGGSVHRAPQSKSVSEATYGLLSKLKRQDGGSTSPQHLYDPHPVPKKVPALKNPPHEPSTMATLSALFNNMGLNYNVPPGARESSNIEDLRGHTGSSWAPQAIASPPEPTFNTLMQPSLATDFQRYAPELGSSGPVPFEPFLYPMKP